MFRIDKSSVSYKKTEQPFIVTHATVGKVAPLPDKKERSSPKEQDSPDTPQTQQGGESGQENANEQTAQPSVTLPDPVKLVEEARVQAEALRIQAQAQAQEALDEAAAKSGAVLSEAREEGYKDGYAKGEADGADAYAALIEQAREQLQAVLTQIDGQRLEMVEQMERECLSLSIEIAQKILGTVLTFDETAFISMVRNGISRVMHEGRVTVRVSPEECMVFFPDGGRELSTDTLTVTVVEDDTLKDGDIRVESDIESVNAGVSRQMEAIAEALAQAGENA